MFFTILSVLLILLSLIIGISKLSFLLPTRTLPTIPTLPSRIPSPSPSKPPLPQTVPTREELSLLSNDLKALKAQGASTTKLTEQARYRTGRLTQALAATYDDSLVAGLIFTEEELSSFPKEARPFLEEHNQTLTGTIGEGVVDGIRPEDSKEIFTLHKDDTHELILLIGKNLTSPKIPNATVTVTGTRVGNVILMEGNFQNVKPPSSPSSSKQESDNPLSKLLQKLVKTAQAYNLSGYAWPSRNISASYTPDGTDMLWGYTNSLFAELNPVAPTATWQREFARALATWAEHANINFHFVPDDGSQWAIWGLGQGDPRFGDIRLGARPGGGLAASAYPTTKTYDGTDGGDITLNTNYSFQIGSDYDLYSVLLHESGHSLGLSHSTTGTVMYGTYTGIKTALSADDISGIQAIYGPRQPDTYDTTSPNNTLSSATSLTLDTSNKAILQADLTTGADMDYYKVTSPSSFDGTLQASVDPSNLSLLAPKVSVYTNSGTLLGTSTVDQTYGYGTKAAVTLSNLSPNQTYYFQADGASNNDVFSTGAYNLNIQFGGITPPPPPPPHMPHMPTESPTPTPTPTSTPTPTPTPTTIPDTTPPTVSITSPLNGSTVTRNKVTTIKATATDNVAVQSVQFFVNSTLTCTDTLSPYTCSWKVPGTRNKTYTLQAKATDTSNNTTLSSPVSVVGK